MSLSLSVVIPVYNEVENIDVLVRRVVEACTPLPNKWEVVLV
ncbi:MAG: glycosyltransferase, partial [Phycisphaerae bacterium]|nr:glycosyltransferase [Phycisphaerae bacterium]